MDHEWELGSMNGHAVGRILKEAVRRAAVVIRNERASFEAHSKLGYSGSMDDVFTSADKNAQEIYLRTFRECFPNCGVIAEEEGLRIEPKNGCTAYFTVDPLDGTKAFVRRQSHGISTMVALVDKGEVLAAYIGDVNAEEVYGYRPGSSNVHRITRLDTFESLDASAPSAETLFQSSALLRHPLNEHSQTTQVLVSRFKTHEVMGSSIGTWAARLWKGEVGALFINNSYETPWDSTPVFGISKKLGYAFLRPEAAGWRQYEPSLPVATYRREQDALIVHASWLPAIEALAA